MKHDISKGFFFFRVNFNKRIEYIFYKKKNLEEKARKDDNIFF